MRPLTEIYLSIFVLFFRITRWEGRLKAAAASLFVSLVAFLAILTLWTFLQLVNHQYVVASRWVFGGCGVAVVIVNACFLEIRGVTFERQFRHFSRKKQLALYLVAIALVAGTFAAFFFAVSFYHEAFHFPRR
jgi:hypothetical protein